MFVLFPIFILSFSLRATPCLIDEASSTMIELKMSGHDSNNFFSTKKGEILELKVELNSQYKTEDLKARLRKLEELASSVIEQKFRLSSSSRSSGCRHRAEAFGLVMLAAVFCIVRRKILHNFRSIDHGGTPGWCTL